MAYTRSRARKQFDIDVIEILSTIRTAHSSQCSSPAIRTFALCAAVLLCSARFESYIEDLIGNWGRLVTTQAVTTERLPRRLRAFLLNQPAVVAAYRAFIVDNDELSFLSKLETLIGQAHYEFALDGRPLPPFSVRLLYADRKYPSPKNLKRLFDRLGLRNSFGAMNALARRDTEGMLTSFNDLRTEMAHTGMPVGLSVGDIRQRIKDMQIIVGCIDRMFYRHVCGSVGSACWMS
jgi:hypothetical protein